MEGPAGTAKGKERVEGGGTESGSEELEVTARPGGGVKKGRKGKERETGETGKGEGKSTRGTDVADEGEGEEEEGKESVEGQGASAKGEPMDTMCNEAIFGYCRVNLFSPPAPIVFGRYNKRPLVEAKARSFAVNVGATNVRPFARGNMLPLVISKSDIEEECYQVKPNVERAPFLKLKAEVGGRSGYGLKFAGGRHRYRAMEMLREKSREIVTSLKDKIGETQSVMKKTEGEGKRHANAVEKIGELEQRLKAEMEVEENLSVWGVILYEEGE